ncbi:SusC/RagA family TonB-linked outer membrane protein [Saccharicrinis aurantiacus]|uniref:SusC/RagA family TonB-linked outer membrane protein n=1 Tax=Saccharicrinis aurantiacus TaxID=1849719 RepID=UPI000838B6D2|nr:TonB-dependent receptor [Saccharicrinis aurantiacus]
MNKNLKQLFKTRQKWLLLFLLSTLSTSIFAQQSFITGIVISAEDNLPIPGASVVVKGTTNGTITDLDGKFNIKANRGKTLVFSFVGMKNSEKVITGGRIDIILEPEYIGLDEVVAIGYGTQKKKEISGAVTQVKSEDITRMATADLGTALQGQVAGVNVQAASGAPGEGSNIQIRGISSIEGSNAPLFVVDGIPQEGDPRLSNNEIETLDILKDAASCAIYGTRGAGGVILITTKQGEAGTVKVSVDSYMGIQKITSGIPLMGFEDYWYSEYKFQQNNNSKHSDDIWTALQQNPANFTNNTNIINTVQNDNAIVQNHSVSISGGKDDVRFSLVGSYFNQDGILLNSGYERFNLRTNTHIKKGKWNFTLGLGMRVDERERQAGNLLYDAYKYKPFQPSLDPDQTVGEGSNETNATTMGNMMKKFLQTDVETGQQFNGNLNVKYNIAKGFDFNSRFGASFYNSNRKRVNPPMNIFDANGDEIIRPDFRSKIQNWSTNKTTMTWENSLTYTKKINNHKFKLLGVFSTEKYTNEHFWASKMDLAFDGVYVINGGTADPNAGSGTSPYDQDKINTLVGMLGRFQYDYKGRYMLSASLRRDGSSRFAKQNRWGMFPSASAAWNIADENFWSSISQTVNSFKLRASIGTTGNQNFADYSYTNTVGLGYDYPMGNDMMLGYIQTGFANPDVKWETTIQSNIGIDMGLLKNRLTFTADIYQSNKNDMLFSLLLPTSTGAGRGESVILNAGDMVNKGIELAAGWRQSGKFSWGVNGTFTKNKNTITRMSGDTDIYPFSNGYAVNNNYVITGLKEGYEAGAFFVMPTNGIANTEEKLAKYQQLDPTAKLGDLMYVDTDGDGKLTEADKVYGGSGMPDFELGLNMNASYKNFDISMQWYASVGNDIINGSRLYAMQERTHQDMIYQWTPSNTNTTIPAHRGSSHQNSADWADIWVEDGSFVRLRNVTLGYTLPKSTLNNIGIRKFRVYIATDNPLTITNYSGYDPEVGGNGLATRGLDKGNYPIASQYRCGVQLDF